MDHAGELPRHPPPVWSIRQPQVFPSGCRYREESRGPDSPHPENLKILLAIN